MKRYNLLTPEGTRDLLFDESVARRKVEEKLHMLFQKRGFSEIITPGIEFYDVFDSKSRYFAPENMYKLTDAKGRLIVLRPDSTMPIARLIATRLKNKSLPLKLYYSQNIFRINPKDSGRDDEITQCGIEIIGGEIRRADFEAMYLAVEILKGFDNINFRFEIGNCGFFRELISQLPLSDDEAESIRYFVETKNYPELDKVLSPYKNYEYAEILSFLPRLFGGKEIFQKAKKIFKSPNALKLLNELNSKFEYLSELGIGDMLSVDLGMVNKINYYTGVLFNGYIEGYGMPIISGGRYDTLLNDFGDGFPAVGFAVNVNAAAKSLLKENHLTSKIDVLIHADYDRLTQALNRINQLTEKGLIVELSLFSNEDEAKKYAAQKGINKIEII